MKLKYFGTAAAEGFPGIFCRCGACEKARKAGGRNLRTRSQALVDDRLLIDFPPDTYMHVLHGGLDLTSINSCIITHGHTDHLYERDFEMRRDGFAYDENGKPFPPLALYASNATAEIIRSFARQEKLFEHETITLTVIEPFKKFTVEGYDVVPMTADHRKEVEPVFFSISDKSKTILYANDTGYFPDETWDYLEREKPFFSFVSLDCTGILIDYPGNHMGIESNKRVKKRLIDMGCADESTVFCMHHFSHNGTLIYDELVPVAKEAGFIVSYDGLEVEI